MYGRFAISLLALGATVAVTWPRGAACVHASDPGDLLPDTDDDFLPDCVEWAVMTNASNGDTDGDLVSDFVEVVQRGNPRQVGTPLPTDQEMRVVVTGPQPGSVDGTSWLHLFVRLMEPQTPMSGFHAWLELPALPGARFSFDMLSMGPIVYRNRAVGSEGQWVQVSVPLVSSDVLRLLLPCSIHVESIVGGRYLRSDVGLFNVSNTISTLVPWDAHYFAVQSIAPSFAGGGGLSNRVCLLDLQEQGSGPGGTVFVVLNAFCDDCNEVECSPNCPSSIGWVITVPGGLGSTGG